ADEDGGMSGARLLDAWLIGIEVIAWLGEAFNLSHYSKGWHTTLTLGAPGVAAACARLLGLDKAATAHAIGLSVSMATGSKRQFGSMAKPVHAGMAAKAGILAAGMARAGVDAAPDVFEGRWGMLEMMAGPDAAGFGPTDPPRSGPGAVERYGVWFKAWPSCGSTHRPVAAALALRDQGGWVADEIAQIEAFVSPTAVGNLRFIYPESPAEAKFCLPFCVCSALLDGRLGLASFAPARTSRADVRALTGRFVMTPDPALSGQALGAALFEHGTVEITLRSGRRLRAGCEHPPGHPQNPMPQTALREKFFDCAGYGGVSAAAARKLWEDVSGLGGPEPCNALLRADDLSRVC
ncbi:MAG TPA: MmgE/PrpD family protein, partial [Paenirhodobacter sp.]